MKFIKLFFVFIFLSPILSAQDRDVKSLLKVLDVQSGAITLVRTFPYTIEAPFWDKTGTQLIYNSGGKLYRINVDAPEDLILIPTGKAQNCNNDHVLSPDGQFIGISDQSEADRKSRIYIVPAHGGNPKLITSEGPSYLHGWSPDGSTLTYCAERNGNFDVYTIPIKGGKETRLTTNTGLDDGPEYSPDGKYIWFNSSVENDMQIWRMKKDGSQKKQITFLKDDYAWFPHVSPDNKKVVFITYRSDEVGAEEHLPNKHVSLRIMNTDGKNVKILADLFGGQGTMNVNSWSPDSQKIAFVSYELKN